MITKIEALNFRCLRYVSQPLDRFHVLVGPNASGKTTFLDVVAFLGRLISDGLDAALEERSPNFLDHVYRQRDNYFELSLEIQLPRKLIEGIISKQSDDVGATPEFYNTLRYETRFTAGTGNSANTIELERLFFLPSNLCEVDNQDNIELTANASRNSSSIIQSYNDWVRTIIYRDVNNAQYYMEDLDFDIGRNLGFQLPRGHAALASLPEDESKFSAAIWLKKQLKSNIHRINLDSQKMRLASPPGQGRYFKPDGSNLPWVIDDFIQKSPNEFKDWIDHLKTALPDLVNIRTVERQDDKHRYLMLEYQEGLQVPSWTVSDGTLRLLALTLLAYLPSVDGAYLIEEPENGIHPKAVETLHQSLSNVYQAQILLATHSPVILSMTQPANILCFAKDQDGATDIISGDQHPALLHWQRETSLGDLFAAGVLG